MTTRALIAEDEPHARTRLRELLGEVEWVECVGEAADGATAVRMIDQLKPDVVFLDIQMPELTGLEVLERVETMPAVVFTTAYDRFAVAAFELAAIDYLLKPFGRERLHAALERVRRAGSAPAPARIREVLSARNERVSRILVRDRGQIIPLSVADIVRLEADDDYVGVIARGRRFLVYLPMAEFEARLDPERFVRVHRSHIVNLDHVVAMTAYDGSRLQVEMKDGAKILASRARSRELRQVARLRPL